MIIFLGGLPLPLKRNQNFPTRYQSHRFVFGVSKIVRQPTSSLKIPIYGNVAPKRAPLYHAESIVQIISQATVSQELHDALEKSLRASEYLSESLADEIKNLEVETSRSSFYGRGGVVSAKIVDVHSVTITSLNILDQQEQTFTCEPEIEAEISLEIDVEVESWYGGPEDYGMPERHSISQTRTEYFYPEVVVRLEPSTGDLDFESIYLGAQSVQVGYDDVERHLRW